MRDARAHKSAATAPVTVVVPCYNEEDGLPFLLERLRHMRTGRVADWQFLFVDDGSDDGTFTALLRAAQDAPWVRVIRHHENAGLGAALRTALSHVRSPIVCTMDSDCTYPPERLTELVALVERGDVLVTASPWHPESIAAEGSQIRLGMSRGVSGLYRGLIGQDVHTFTSLFRAYRTDVVRDIRIRSDGFAAVAEILLRMIMMGHRVAEVPMRLESRRFGESKMRLGDAVAAHVRLLMLTGMLVGLRQARNRGGARFLEAERFAVMRRPSRGGTGRS